VLVASPLRSIPPLALFLFHPLRPRSFSLADFYGRNEAHSILVCFRRLFSRKRSLLLSHYSSPGTFPFSSPPSTQFATASSLVMKKSASSATRVSFPLRGRFLITFARTVSPHQNHFSDPHPFLLPYTFSVKSSS